jgi:hypothetical protein
MNFKPMMAALALAAATSASYGVTCTKSFELGSMGPPATQTLGNSFSTSGGFNDCYNFSVAAPANASGTTSEQDGTLNWSFMGFSFQWVLRDIELSAVSLYNSAGAKLASDTAPESFSFANLGAGAYSLVVTGASMGLPGVSASYSGTLTTNAVAAAVPEPSLVALMGLALAGAGFTARRRKS